jgi:predicted nucleotidyltransferase component of viral defense system
VQRRLVSHAKAINVDPNLVLVRYATERLLYRLSQSTHAGRFILKGGALMLVWLGETIRPTRDIDLLGFGDLEATALARTFADICATPVEPDGLVFDAKSVRVEAIRPEDDYGGQRVVLAAHLGPARLRIQVDIGIGDSVVPDPEWLDYPSLLDLPRPKVRAYRRETAIAEKVHAMVVLGTKNSRMRDFFDVHALAMHTSFDGRNVARAFRSTFTRRKTPLPIEVPVALTRAFADIEGKREQWAAFVQRNRLTMAPQHLDGVTDRLTAFVWPPLAAAAADTEFGKAWSAGGPWK